MNRILSISDFRVVFASCCQGSTNAKPFMQLHRAAGKMRKVSSDEFQDILDAAVRQGSLALSAAGYYVPDGVVLPPSSEIVGAVAIPPEAAPLGKRRKIRSASIHEAPAHPVEDTSAAVDKSIAYRRHQLIAHAITSRLGMDWDQESLKDRLVSETVGTNTEVRLDGSLLLEIEIPGAQIDFNAGWTTATWQLKYRLHPKPPPDPLP